MAKSIIQIAIVLCAALHTLAVGAEPQLLIGPGRLYSISLPPFLQKSSNGGCDLKVAHPTEKISFEIPRPKSTGDVDIQESLPRQLRNLELDLWLASHPFLKKVKGKDELAGKNWIGKQTLFQGINPKNGEDRSLIYVEAESGDGTVILFLYASTAALNKNERMLQNAIKSLLFVIPDESFANQQRASESKGITSLDGALLIELPRDWVAMSSCSMEISNSGRGIVLR